MDGLVQENDDKLIIQNSKAETSHLQPEYYVGVMVIVWYFVRASILQQPELRIRLNNVIQANSKLAPSSGACQPGTRAPSVFIRPIFSRLSFHTT